MFGEKKNRNKEVKWIVTFADLITLLFCFFVYLSLFNKPQVDLKTGFVVTEDTITSLSGRLPENVVGTLDSMIGDFFEKLSLNLNFFDISFFLVLIYCVIQCFIKGFSLSLISFMKCAL